MNANHHSSEPPEHINKGKKRALETLEPTEHTPLLASTSSLIHEATTPVDSRRRLRYQLTKVFLGSLSACILVFCVLALLAWSYASRASSLNPDDIINRDITIAGPHRIDVIEISPEGIRLKVEGDVGVDAGAAIGINTDPHDGLLKSMWKSLGRWGVETLDTVSVEMSDIIIRPEHDSETPLFLVKTPPVELPLTVDPPKGTSWLTPLAETIFVQQVANSTVLLHFLKDSWNKGFLGLGIDVKKAVVRGGSFKIPTWRNKFASTISKYRTHLQIPLPVFPNPGGDTPLPPLSELITLKSFNVTTRSQQLFISATATFENYIPSSFDSLVPPLPFEVSLVNEPGQPHIPVASVESSKFGLTHPNVTLSIAGKVLPLPPTSYPLLSRFVTRYLSSEDNDILVSSPLLPGVVFPATFPAPHPRPHLLKNVTISNMKIIPAGSAFLASGTVHARVVLPAGVTVGLDVYRILPDVLIFDGEVPASSMAWRRHKKHNDTDLPPEPPLPDPLPEHAFGHIRPDDWLPSLSIEVDPEEGEGAAFAVSAEVEEVPLRVLPGRQKEFSNFVGKVIFGSEGAVAGILGSAAVTVAVEGLPLHLPGRKPGEVVLSGLPFQGSVIIGKKGL